MHALVDVHLTTADQSEIRKVYLVSVKLLPQEEKIFEVDILFIVCHNH